MTNTNKTIADIVAEMRRGFDKSWHDIDREWAHGLADRIEAACNREAEIAYLKGQTDEIMNAVTKLETWRANLCFKLSRLHD